MWPVQAPRVTVEDTFTKCISGIADDALRGRLNSVQAYIIAEASRFSLAARDAQLHTIAPMESVEGVVTQPEMSRLYKNKMAHPEGSARDIYDTLMGAAPFGRCPLCGHRYATTIDHHLPQARFPALAVTPVNLVPACKDCNKAKMSDYPRLAEHQTLHPYYDDVDEERWLHAEVVEGPIAALRFYVNRPEGWDDLTAARVLLHFKTFGLATLFATQGAEEMGDLRGELEMIFSAGGSEAIRSDLLRRAQSCSENRLNSRRTATFYALATSDWYCDGGFVLR